MRTGAQMPACPDASCPAGCRFWSFFSHSRSTLGGCRRVPGETGSLNSRFLGRLRNGEMSAPSMSMIVAIAVALPLGLRNAQKTSVVKSRSLLKQPAFLA